MNVLVIVRTLAAGSEQDGVAQDLFWEPCEQNVTIIQDTGKKSMGEIFEVLFGHYILDSFFVL